MEYVIHDGITILLVVEASNTNLASIKARRNTTLPPVIEITPLADFRTNDEEGVEALRTARRHHYEAQIKRGQEDIRAAECALKQAQTILRKLEREALDKEQAQKTKNCKTCKGKGWVHTYSREIPHEGSDRCPDCKKEED
jgi:hypothetical protein